MGVSARGVVQHAMGQTPPPPVNRIIDRCKNITLPQTFFAGGNYPEICWKNLLVQKRGSPKKGSLGCQGAEKSNVSSSVTR